MDSLSVNLYIFETDDEEMPIDNHHDFVPIFNSFTSRLEVVLNVIFLTLGTYEADMLPSLLRFQRVQRLRLAEGWEDIISILQSRHVSSTAPVGNDGALLFPCLKTIVIEPHMARNPECAAIFISLLRWRVENGVPIV